MVFLIYKEPYTLRTVDLNGQKIPQIELFNAQNFQMKEGGIDSIVASEKVARFDDHDQLYTINATHKTKEGYKGLLVSDEAIVKDKIVHFMTNSHYKRDDGVALDGEDIFYELGPQILRSDKPFIFTQKQSRTNGLSFVYQMKEGTIKASNIHSYIQQVKQIGKKK